LGVTSKAGGGFGRGAGGRGGVGLVGAEAALGPVRFPPDAGGTGQGGPEGVGGDTGGSEGAAGAWAWGEGDVLLEGASAPVG
jgi:hypothetical protein